VSACAQHPDASVTEGERLIKSIYEALRNSEFWEDLAFIITYDEHGPGTAR
jgi:phospholipase C